MRPSWLKPPDPPPPEPTSFHPLIVALVFLIWSAYTLLLFAFRSGRWGVLNPKQAKYVWVCPLFLVLSWVALGGGLTMDVTLPRDKMMNGEMLVYMAFRILPIAGFGMLVVSEVST